MKYETLESRTMLSVDYDYLSNLRPTFAVNGYGPVEKDMSAGQIGQADGKPITLNGVVYRKGVGVHSEAELRYKLSEKYKSFISDVGIDDEVGDGGSAIFQVFADGTKLFDSGVMYGSSATRRVNVDVSGVSELILIVKDAGDGFFYDHADFGGARLVRPTGVAPVVTLPETAYHLDEARGFLAFEGSFTDASAGPWFASVDWGDGSSRNRVELSEEKTFHLNHWFPVKDDGVYTVTVRVSNGKAVGIGRVKVQVDNLPPTRVGLVGQTDSNGNFSALAGVPFTAGGTFSDPGEFGGETYTAVVDFGDGTDAQAVEVFGRFFEVEHVFARPGTYNVTSTVTDDGGEEGKGISTVIVTAADFTYLADLTATRVSGPYNINRSYGGSPMTIAGARHRRGLGVVSESELVFTLGGAYDRLLADVGVDDGLDASGGLRFQVYTDHAIAFDSGEMVLGDPSQRMDVNVSGVNEIRLIVTRTGEATLHGDWGGIRVLNT